MERINSNGSAVHSNLTSPFRRFTFRGGKKEKPRNDLEGGQASKSITHISIPDFRSPREAEALSARSVSPGSIGPLSYSPGNGDDALHQLQKIILKLRSSLKKNTDDAFDIYAHHAQTSIELCTSLIQKPRRDGRNDSLVESLSDVSLVNTSSSSTSRGIDARTRSVHEYFAYQKDLLESICSSLSKIYLAYKPHAQKSQIEALFSDRTFRDAAIHEMRNTSINKMISDPPLAWELYKIRFRNYEKLKRDIADIEGLFREEEAPATTPCYIRIAENGDTILEFNSDGPGHPILRFRVSSHMLCEVSPLFAQILSNTPINRPDFLLASELYSHETLQDLPPPPTTQVLRDGSSVKVYRMPQIELNKHNSLTTLLQAAHMHRDQVPREISFPEFVSIAEVCLKYRCTSPVEDSVECRWLVKWISKAADEIPDAGLLLICYVFGLSRLFFRMSKSAILNMKDENDLASNVPEKVRDKIITVRTAKLKQVQRCCMMVISDYLGTQARDPNTSGSLLSSVSRCPKGDHSCDAQNLGWMMLVFKELGILPSIMSSEIPAELPRGSLKDLMNKLRLVTGPVSKDGHGEVCDFAPAFRNAIDDVYNSITGLTLKDVSGQEGWSLSRLSNSTPLLYASLSPGVDESPIGGRRTIHKPRDPKNHNFIIDADITLRILSLLGNFNDLRSAAMVKKSFYAVYKSHKVSLMTGLLLKAERRTTISRNSGDSLTLRQPLWGEISTTPNPNRQLHTASSDGRLESNGTPILKRVEKTRSSPSPLDSSSQTAPVISEEEMERILWPETTSSPSTPPISDLQLRSSVSRFSISTSSSHSDLINSVVDDSKNRNEKYLLESKDDSKHRMLAENKYLREEGDRRLGIGRI